MKHVITLWPSYGPTRIIQKLIGQKRGVEAKLRGQVSVKEQESQRRGYFPTYVNCCYEFVCVFCYFVCLFEDVLTLLRQPQE